MALVAGMVCGFLTGEPARESPASVPAGTAAARLAEAQKALKAEAFAAARQLLLELPSSLDAVALLAAVHEHYYETDEARRWWQRCLQRDPGRADACVALGQIAADEGDWKQSAEMYRRAIRLQPDAPTLHGRYGEALLEIGKVDEAIAALRIELERTPEEMDTHLLLAKAFLQKKQYDQAIAAYEQAARVRPASSLPYHGLAIAYGRAGRPEDARGAMERFRKLRQAEDTALDGRKRLTRQKPVRGEQILAETLATAAAVYFAHRRGDLAEKCLLRAAEVDPKDQRCRQYLVNYYRRTRRPTQALNYCRQLLALDASNARYHLNTGVVLAEAGRLDEAGAEMRKAIRLAPEKAPAYRSLVRLLLARGRDAAEARALAQRLVTLEKSAENYDLLAAACLRTGDRNGALAARQQAEALRRRGRAGTFR